MKINNENYEHIDLLKQTDNLNDETDRESIINFLDDLGQEFKDSTAIKRNRLFYVQGEEFRKRFDEFIRPYFIKGLPSIFSEVKQLIDNNEKSNIMEEVIINHIDIIILISS